MHYLIVTNLLHGRSPPATAQAVGVARSTISRVAQRFREHGEAELIDRREDNGAEKLDEKFLAILYDVVESSPKKYGWMRPTGTREMLVANLTMWPLGYRVRHARVDFQAPAK